MSDSVSVRRQLASKDVLTGSGVPTGELTGPDVLTG